MNWYLQQNLKQIQTNRNFVLNVGSIPTLPTIVWLFKWEGWNVGVVRKGEKKYSVYGEVA